MFIQSFSVFLFVYATLAQDITSEIEETPPEQGRDLRNYNQEWKTLDYFSPNSDTSEWIPHDTEAPNPKRRRIRKRKRRPPVILTDQAGEETTTRKRFHRLDQIKEPWEDINEETSQRSYNRRRLTPIYDETVEIKNTNYEKIRDPFTALQEAEEKQKKKVEENTTADLRTLLKQSGDLSLSEILQQKNLSLAELLNGNRQAISALTEKGETTTETIMITENNKYRRLPPSLVLKKDVNQNFEQNDESLTSHEILDAQRRRLALLHSHKETKMYADVTKVDVVTEETTEKRLFVPSFLMEKPVLTTTPPPTTTTKTKPFKSRISLPLTSAKLNRLTSKAPKVNRIPAKAVTIDIEQIFGFDLLGKNKNENSDGPFKMTIDLEVTTTEKPTTTTRIVELKTTATLLGEKLKHVTAKEEIMEILKNPIEREHLSRILRTRNMTVEELVEQRERGSSQLHLADIFHNKSKEPEPKDEPFIGHINPEGFNSYQFFNRKQKSRVLPTVARESTTLPSPRFDKTTTPKLPQYTITSFPTYKIETNKQLKNQQPFLPIWEQLYPSLFADVYENNHYENQPEFIKNTATTSAVPKVIFEDLDNNIDDIENILAEAASGEPKTSFNQNLYDDNEFINLPSGVKSAILASFAIIGLSLLVFLSILVIFKWSQKQKRRLNYTGSFSGSKIKSPILAVDQKRTFRTFMTETLGKKKNYYKTHLQNMSDNIWDNDEKKSYMI